LLLVLQSWLAHLLPVSPPRLRLLLSLRRVLVTLWGSCLLLLLLLPWLLLLLPLMWPPRRTGPMRVTFATFAFATFATFAVFAAQTPASASVPPQTFERSVIADLLCLREFPLQFHYLTRLNETTTVSRKSSRD